jgi:lipoprotein-anchoring transpeptidase ErfK/SrfK
MQLRVWVCVLAILGAAFSAGSAQAGVRVDVDLSQQRMKVYVRGALRHVWRVSSGRRGYRTPTGRYRPTWMRRMHYSRKYNMAPMPHSIFFYGGYAIHGTNHVSQLGRPASHGCIRLAPGNARRLFNLVQANGPRRTRIRIRH